MFITNTNHFPIVNISYQAEYKQSLDELFEKFNTLLEYKRKFVFISEGPMNEAESENDHESRKKVSLWVKNNRHILSEFVLALIHIEPDADQRAKLEQFSAVYAQFSGYPLYIVSSQEQADKLTHQLLNK